MGVLDHPLIYFAVILQWLALQHTDAIVNFPDGLAARKLSQDNSTPEVTYQTRFFTQQVDHFSFQNSDTFQQKYLVADQYWKGAGYPIFFYTGNEGDITWFCNNTGLMWDWAPQFGALLVFAEHRYYGESLPYGKESFQDLPHLGPLSSEQALADFVTLLDHVKGTLAGAGGSPVVAFGGSYGGMLAAWLRIKYPHAVVGSLAASAPIWMFTGMTGCESFFRIVTDDFQREGTSCVKNIRKSWSVLTDYGKTAIGRRFLTKTFRLCKPLEDSAVLKAWLSSTYTNLAMVDYPYPASFLEPLPAWPIKEVCRHLNASEDLSAEGLVRQLYEAVNVYYNYTGSKECLDTSEQASGDLGVQGWNFQSCTEMVMPLCMDGVSDMFEPAPWNMSDIAAACKRQWGVEPRPRWPIQEYGGKNIKAASNIIFSNGDFDPWSAGGVTQSLSKSLVALTIKDGAHHLDLRFATPSDPESVVQARKTERNIVSQWLQEYHSTTKSP